MKTRMFTALAFALAAHWASAQTLQPIYRAAFDEASLAEAGWGILPSGSGEFTPAPASIGLIPGSPSNPGFTNGRGVVVTAVSGQGSLIYGPAIPTGGDPVLIRLSVFAQAAGASVAVGALDVPPGGSIASAGGSVAYSIETDSAVYTQDYTRVRVLYRPKSRAIVPVFQLAVAPGTPNLAVTGMFDNFEVYVLNEQTVPDPALRELFGIAGGAAQPTLTPTPTVTPTPQPGGPTPTPPIGEGGQVFVDEVLAISPTNDTAEAQSPAAAHGSGQTYAVVAADRTFGFPDILLRNVTSPPGTIGEAFTVNETFEDTEATGPDIEIGADGTRHIVWSDDRSVEKLASVWLAQYNEAGQRIGGGDFETNLLFENTDAVTPAIGASPAGDLAVVWMDNRNFLNDIFVRRFRWAGNQLTVSDSADFQVNIPFENTNAMQPDIAVGDGGAIAAVWTDNRFLVEEQKRFDVFARVFSMDTPVADESALAESVAEIQLNELDNALEDPSNPAAAWSNGRFLAVWENGPADGGARSINAAVFGEDGTLIHTEFFVSGDDDHRYSAPSVGVLDTDVFQITWHDGTTDEILMRLYDAAQHMYLSDPVVIAEGAVSVARTATAGGADLNFLTAWDGQAGNRFDVFGLSGFFDTNPPAAKMSKPASVSENRTVSPSASVRLSQEGARSPDHTRPARQSGGTSPRRGN